MGIKNLSYLFKNKYKVKKREYKLRNIPFEKIGIDTSLFLYRFYYNMNNVIECFIKQILCFKRNNKIPVYVLDGGWTEEKKDIIEIRNKKKEEIRQKINNTTDYFERRRLEKKLVYFKKSDIEKLKNIFFFLGIDYVEAEDEADKVLVNLAKKGRIDAVLSEDTDFIAMNCPVVLKNFSLRNETIDVVYPSEIIKNLKVTEDEFLKICILSGSDYTQKIKGEKITEIYDDVIENRKNYSPFSLYSSKEDMSKYINAFNLFKKNSNYKYFSSQYSYYFTKKFLITNDLLHYFNQIKFLFP